jgi:hypothetical protein
MGRQLMPTNRIRIKRAARSRVTDQVVALFCKCCEIQKSGDEEFWAEDGGRRREYLDACRDLYSLLGLPPWHASPLDTDLTGPAPYNPEGCWADTRPAALELRREILAAMKRGQDDGAE